MARSIISPQTWERAREYFEHGLTLDDISERTGITKGAISKKSRAEKWEKESIKKHILSQAVGVAEAKETLKETAVAVHEELYSERTKYIEFFKKSALVNQKKANAMLEMSDKLSELESHSKITQRNKETVLGKDASQNINVNTQTNITNNTIQVEFIE